MVYLARLGRLAFALVLSAAVAQGDTVTVDSSGNRLIYEMDYDSLAANAEAQDCSEARFEAGLLHGALRNLFLYLPLEASFYTQVETLEVRVVTTASGTAQPVLLLRAPLAEVRKTNPRFRAFMNSFASVRAKACFAVEPGTLTTWLDVLGVRGGTVAYSPEVFETAIAQAVDIAQVTVSQVDGLETDTSQTSDTQTTDTQTTGLGDAPALATTGGFSVLEPTGLRATVFAAPGDVLEPNTDYMAVLETNRGTMLVDLLENDAPQTVNNFVFLTQNRFYDGLPFHRVIGNFVAQTGDPSGTGNGGPGYSLPDEITPGLSHSARGVVSMVDTGPDSSGSQFFITFGAAPWLDGNNTIFAQVVEGADVLDVLQPLDPAQPFATALLSDTLGLLATQGIFLEGDPVISVAAYLVATLGGLPEPGRRVTVGNYSVVVGVQPTTGLPSIGFWPPPDRIERAYILARRGE